jgi:hypothetical protein
VEARLKGSGMHWADQHVNPMLALRNIVCSRRWKEDWPRIEKRLRQQAFQRKQKLHLSRKKPAPAPRSTSRRDAFLAAKKISLWIPSNLKNPKDNPWRKFKFGRALYQRENSPKK